MTIKSNTPWRKLRAEIQGMAKAYSNVIVMTSGGVDSMFLADFVTRAGINPTIVHFRHGIRDNDYAEAELVRKFAEDNGLAFHLGEGEGLADALNQELLAREQRIAFVEKLIEGMKGVTLVMTAHHHDDNIENFFMAAARGRSLMNLTMRKHAMVQVREGGHCYFRYKPLLDVEKEEIYEQARKRNLSWIEDPTNAEEDHERNLFRNRIIPEMMDIRNIRKSMRNLFREIEDLRDKEGLRE